MKKPKSDVPKWRYLKKLFLTMRICVFLLLMSIFSVQAGTSYSQNTKLTLKLKQVTLHQLIREIENKSEFIFLFNEENVDLNKKINLNVEAQSIEAILKKIHEETGNSYQIFDRQIVLGEKSSVHNAKPQPIEQPRKTISGTVTDEKGTPIPGAAILIKGTTVGITADIDGKFELLLPANAKTLVVSFVGMKTMEIGIEAKTNFQITLEEANVGVEEVVVTAFGAGQKKASMVGAVQQVKPMELKVPSSSLTTSFAGRLAGVIAVQRSGQPGADGADFWIRGKSTFSGATGALIIIDGIEMSSSDLNALDPEVIDGFSILKDATATALYGTRGANGVMIVTTKQGQDRQKPVINVRMEGGISQLTSVPGMVGGVDYMKLYNEAMLGRNAAGPLYSEDKIAGTEQGLNPYIYPNVDWYNEMFNKNTFAERFNFNIRGGRGVVNYFMSASIKNDNGNLKSISKDYFSFNNNIRNLRYDFINNIDVKATETTKVSLGLNVNMVDWSGPKTDADNLFSLSREASPVDFPIRFPDTGEFPYIMWGGKSGGIYNSGYRNPVAEYVTSYKETFMSKLMVNLKLNQDLDMLVKGLKFSGLVSFKNRSLSAVNRDAAYNQFELSTFDPSTYDFTLNRVGSEQNTLLNSTFAQEGDRQIYIQSMLEYNTVIKDVHDLNAMFLYNQDQFNISNPADLLSSLSKRKQGIAGRISYAYDNKYLAEVNFGYNGSENFAEGNRFGFFPSFAVGYNISEEKFWENISNTISRLKLRGSWGFVGNDATGAGRFAYLEDITLQSYGYTTGGIQNITQSGPKWNRYFNPDMTWEVGEKLNAGMDIQFFNALNLNVDIFKETRKNIFMQRSNTVPVFLGTNDTKIYGNVGKMQNWGIDASLDYNKQINPDLFISVKGTFTFAQNKILERDEPPFRLYPNLSSVGGPMGRYQGYNANGLFKDDQEVIDSPEQTLGFIPQAGDIKYVDIADANGNMDGKINANDRIYMGFPQDPEIVYGLGPSIRYKKVDFSFFFQGVARTSLMMSGFHPFGRNATRGVFAFIANDHWSQDNQNVDAAYPRLTRDSNPNNETNSTYWLRNASFLKLRNIELGYNLKSLRFYVSGANLFTISSFKHWDPEMGGGSGMKYPTQRTLNIGVQMTIK